LPTSTLIEHTEHGGHVLEERVVASQAGHRCHHDAGGAGIHGGRRQRRERGEPRVRDADDHRDLLADAREHPSHDAQ
jgi:hypothetical protein